ncbi:hypothetical protein [Rickettsia endosymbiont of Gonocerus acuteangulatus]
MKSIAHHWMQQGKGEAKAIMAKKMLKESIPLDEIIYFTGLDKEEVEKLM